MSSKGKLDKTKSIQTLKRILLYIKDYRAAVLLSLFLAVTTVASTLYTPDPYGTGCGSDRGKKTGGLSAADPDTETDFDRYGSDSSKPVADEPHQQYHYLPCFHGYTYRHSIIWRFFL